MVQFTISVQEEDHLQGEIGLCLCAELPLR